MDQSASVFPIRGSALSVSFKPSLATKPITFPTTSTPFSFVVAQSFVAADKHVTAPVCYNLRVVECSLAAAFLAKAFGLKKPLPEDKGPLGVSLRGFHDTYFEEKEGIADNTETNIEDFAKQLEKLIHLTQEYLSNESGYTREEIGLLLGMSEQQLTERYMSKFPVRAERFMLRQRALHVFTEALRVIKFQEILSRYSENGEDKASEDVLKELGSLLNTTQDSCRDLYECSCPELDELCSIAREAGAYGSRLTGAGWGGCCVHLVPSGKVEQVKDAWKKKYYDKKFPDMDEDKWNEAVVVSKPGGGSCVFIVNEGKIT
jgi:galactokinase